MKKLTLYFVFLVLAITSCKNNPDQKISEEKKENAPQRIISLNGAITEIVSALGFEDKIVGVDVTSSFPETVKRNAADLGHVSSITIEPILELKPDLILATEKDINQGLFKQLNNAGIAVKIVSQDYSLEGSKTLITNVANILASENHTSLHAQIDTDYDGATSFSNPPKVLFIYARGAGTLMVAGGNTPMRSIVELAGGTYTITDFEDFKPLTPESLVQANPDVILLFNTGLQSLGGLEGLMQVPGISQTQAGKNKAFVAMDGALLSGFGPRVGQAAYELNQALANYAE